MTLISTETGSKAASWRGKFSGLSWADLWRVYPRTWGFLEWIVAWVWLSRLPENMVNGMVAWL